MATKEDVARAVLEESERELLAIMPEAAPLIHRGEFNHLPALFDALRSGELAALHNCKHEYFTEGMNTPEVQGPCGACGKVTSHAYKQGFTKCSKCEGVRCKPCAWGVVQEQRQQESLLRACHEVRNEHQWFASKEDCDRCGKGPCGCGGKRCE